MVPKFTAACCDYRKEFKSQEEAEAWIRKVEEAGHCKQQHHIVPSTERR